jgi:hypothetical protein
LTVAFLLVCGRSLSAEAGGKTDLGIQSYEIAIERRWVRLRVLLPTLMLAFVVFVVLLGCGKGY